MAPIDPQSLESGTPRTFDGREYPGELKQYESYDAQLLPLVLDLGSDFEKEALDALARQELGHDGVLIARWMSSAEWRGLIERTDRSMAAPRTYRTTPRAEARLSALGGNL